MPRAIGRFWLENDAITARHGRCHVVQGVKARGIFRSTWGLFAAGGLLETKLLNSMADLIAAETGQRGGPRVIPAGARQRLRDQVSTAAGIRWTGTAP